METRKNIMKPLKIYCAGKYSADNTIQTLQNIGRGQKMAAELFALGFAPFCPWWDRTFIMDNPYLDFDKSRFYDASLAWMECSDAVYVISGAGDGGGVDAEIKRAGELYIPVFHNLEKLIAWDNSIKDVLK